jgi:hypothetical protein
MTGGEAIVDGLLRHGIDTIFGLPGVQTYGLFDAFARNTNRLRLINARHEQTTAYMALGYAQSSGKPSAFTVVPGPGVMNTMGALTTAWGVYHQVPDPIAYDDSLSADVRPGSGSGPGGRRLRRPRSKCCGYESAPEVGGRSAG